MAGPAPALQRHVPPLLTVTERVARGAVERAQVFGLDHVETVAFERAEESDEFERWRRFEEEAAALRGFAPGRLARSSIRCARPRRRPKCAPSD